MAMARTQGGCMTDLSGTPPRAILEALDLLGIRRLLLGIHDPAFPSCPEEDIGRGSPYSTGARHFLSFIRSLGFNGVQLGPQGITSLANASPYDSTLFSRNPLSLALLPLTRKEWGTLLSGETVMNAAQRCRNEHNPSRTAHAAAWHVQQCIRDEIWNRFTTMRAAGFVRDIDQQFALFRQKNTDWLVRDGLYEALCRHYGGHSWRNWRGDSLAGLDADLWHPGRYAQDVIGQRRSTLLARHHEEIAAFAFIQFLLAQQHQELRQDAHRSGLALFGDLQIGLSDRDAWYAQPFLLPGYVIGAPPSRTNPDGQPWNYPLLNPDWYIKAGTGNDPGPARQFLEQRLDKMLCEFDGLRIDHPHGLICPWVYRAEQPDPLAAVQEGARLFSSPDLPNHPDLARFAIPRPAQINRDLCRYDDNRIHDLEPGQVHRYGLLFAAIVQATQKNNRDISAIACEVLSTQPYPLRRVLEQYGLGRFRVTQKADLSNPADVYRSENAQPEDWIMLGNHDTPPLWLLAERWQHSDMARQQAAYLAERLAPADIHRDAWIEKVAADPGELVQAKAADLFASPAVNVMIFFTDLLGMNETYNRPGVISDENWSLRIPPDFEHRYLQRRAANLAINIPKILAIALRGKGKGFTDAHRGLLHQLDLLAAPE